MPPTKYTPLNEPVETYELQSFNGKARREHYVYIASDERGRILYVGETIDIYRRFSQHSRESAWYTEMAHVKVEVFLSKDEARRRETHLILRFAPPHNIDKVDRRTTEQRRWARQQAELRARQVPRDIDDYHLRQRM